MKLLCVLLIILSGYGFTGDVTVNLRDIQDKAKFMEQGVDDFLDSMEYDFNHPLNWCNVEPNGNVALHKSSFKLEVEINCIGDEKNTRFNRLVNEYQWSVGNGWGGPLYDASGYLQTELRRRFPHIKMLWISQQLMYRVSIRPEYDMPDDDQSALFFKVRVNGAILHDRSRGDVVRIPLRKMIFQGYTIPKTTEYTGLSGKFSVKNFTKRVSITYNLTLDDLNALKLDEMITLSVDNADRIWVAPEVKGYMNKLHPTHPYITVTDPIELYQ